MFSYLDIRVNVVTVFIEDPASIPHGLGFPSSGPNQRNHPSLISFYSYPAPLYCCVAVTKTPNIYEDQQFAPRLVIIHRR